MTDRSREIGWRGSRFQAGRNRRRLTFDRMEERAVPATLGPLADVTLPQFMSRPLVLDGGTTPNQVFTATSTNPNIEARVLSGRFLALTVNHASSGPGDPAIDNETMVFHLYDDLTPLTIARIGELVNDGFYTGKTIHRIAQNFPGPSDFIVQGGSVNGDGTGEVPRPGFPFFDEFVPGLGFTTGGQLAMANAGRDTNSSQFFVTTGQPRALDSIHTIFGQLVSGNDTLTKLTQIPRNASDRPTPNPVTITSATLLDEGTAGVLLVDGTRAQIGDAARVTVTAFDPADGTSTSRTFDVTVAANTQNQRPFFTEVPPLVTVGKNQQAVFATKIFNPEVGDTITYQVAGGKTGDPGNPTFTNVVNGTATIDANGVVRLTPNTDFVGDIQVLVAVRDQVDRFGPGNRNFDLQPMTVRVVDGPAVNLPPIASNGTAGTSAGQPVRIQLRGNPSNVGQGLVYAITQSPANGTITSFDPNEGTLIYTPNPGFTGTDSFLFQVTDTGAPGPNLTSEPARVTINVAATAGTVRLIPAPSPLEIPGTPRALVVTPAPQRFGSRAVNEIVVEQDAAGEISVTINGVRDALTVNALDIDRIVVYGSKASDRIRIDDSVTVPATLSGGRGGSNTIQAGGASSRLHGWYGRNVLRGGPQRDALIGRLGHARLTGSPGDDLYFLGEPRPGNPPNGQFLAFRNGRFVARPTPPPKISAYRPDVRPGGDFLRS